MRSLFQALSIAIIAFFGGTVLAEPAPSAAIQAEAAADKSPDSKPANFKEVYSQYLNLAKEGKWQESLLFIRQAYEMNKSSGGENKKIAAALAFSYGQNLEEVKDYEAAARLYAESLAIDEAAGADSAKLVNTLIRLGFTVGSNKEAEKHYDRALELTAKHYGSQSLEYAKLVLDMGDNFITVKEFEAKKYLQTSYHIVKKELGPKAPLTGLAAFRLGKVYISAGNEIKARDFFQEALNTFDNPEKPDNRMEIMTHGFLVEVYERLGERKEATRHCLAIGRMTPLVDTQNTFPLFRSPPEYPAALAKAGKEGWAMVEFTISPMGFVENPVIVESSDDAFNEPSVDAIKKWRYAPKFVEGKAVPAAGVRTLIKYAMDKDKARF